MSIESECKYPFIEGLGIKANREGYRKFLELEVKRLQEESEELSEKSFHVNCDINSRYQFNG